MRQVQPIQDLKPLIVGQKDNELKVSLRNQVYVPMLWDKEDGRLLAKVIDCPGRITYKPDSDAAAVVLSLLGRDDNDEVLLSDFLNYIKKNLSPSIKGDNDANWPKIEASIRGFLGSLQTDYLILNVKTVPEGTQGGVDLDPVGVVGYLKSWDYQNMSLTKGNPPICKGQTYYSTGYYVVHR